MPVKTSKLASTALYFTVAALVIFAFILGFFAGVEYEQLPASPFMNSVG